jgi:O-glycosyl hydrolase
MPQKNYLTLLLFTALLFLSCTHIGGTLPRTPLPASGTVRINLNEAFQTIHSFGASDCWSAKFIGTWADEAKKNQIADLLFSLDTTASGQPKGIGLSIWRVNIGAGSYEQGEASDIGDAWRREECFQDAQGRYDWSKQAGSQWFLNAARQRGVRYALGFANSPPVHMTVNGKAFSAGGDSLNLRKDQTTPFANFLAEVGTHFGFDYLSPLNEPQWDWKAGKNGKAGQEGTPAQSRDLIAVAKALSSQLTKKGSKATIVTGETAQIDYLYEKAESGRGNQLMELFAENTSLGTLPKVEPIAAYHSYFSTCDDARLVGTRQKALRAAQAAGNPTLWQSEFGVLGNICDRYKGSPRSTGIDYGLYVAKVIHSDLTLANVASWQWWVAINPYNYSDGLVYINGPDGTYKNHDNARLAGQVVDSKQLWAFGNYARFVRPGMKRIGVALEGNADPVAQAGSYMVSAYKDEVTKKLVLVAVNMTSQTVTLPLRGVSVKNNRFTSYTTDQKKNLAKATVASDTVALTPQSVTTLVGYYE